VSGSGQMKKDRSEKNGEKTRGRFYIEKEAKEPQGLSGTVQNKASINFRL